MADKYSTIQQHQPLRVPQGWDKQEKALVVQLDEIFDDIYRRFGRLRMEDMGKAFRKQIEDDEGNIAQLVVDVGQITIEVGNKYDKVSGITINTNGIGLSGSKYIDIASGCYIDIASGGSIDIESGGELEIKSGGTFKIATGGNIDMKASGTLELTGSTVSIKSGSTFDVDSTNFKISSADKSMTCGKWKFDDDGATFLDTDHAAGFPFRISAIESAVTDGAGIAFDDNTGSMSGANIRLYFKKSNWSSTCGVKLIASSISSGSSTWLAASLVPDVIGNGYVDLGESNNYFMDGYFYDLHISRRLYAGVVQVSSVEANKLYGGRAWDDTPSQTDLNLLTDPGLYYLYASDVSHAPSGLSGQFELEITGRSEYYDVIQKIYAVSTIYVRRKPYGSSWGSWYKFTGTAV